MRVLFLLFFGFVLVACQHKPIEDLVLADVALKAAQKVKADALAPDTFRKAENNFLRAQRDFRDGYFDSCRKFSQEARIFAEQAEYESLLKQSNFRNRTEGGVGP